MTTIVYKDGVIAWDSRTTGGDTILCDSSNKCHIVGTLTFWCAGTVGDFGDFFRAYLGDKRIGREVNVSAFVLDSGKLFVVGCNDDGSLWRSQVLYPRAIGSGTDFALAAMDCGLDAKAALKIAAGRDVNTGGKLHSKKIFR